MSANCFLSYISDFFVNYFLDIFYLFIIHVISDESQFSSYFRQCKILSDICGCQTVWCPTNVRQPYIHNFDF